MSARWDNLPVTDSVSIDYWVSEGLSPGPRVLITAGIHGDEYEGPAAVLQLIQELDARQLSGSIFAVPVVNALAFAAGTRFTPEDGRNLAREFPGDANGTITQKLAAAVFGQLAQRATHLIDLHSGGVEYEFTPLAGFYGEPSDGNPSFEAARRYGLPVLWQLPVTAGVLSAEMWKRGGIAIGHEYLGGGRLSSKGAEAYKNGALSCLRWWGLLSDEAPYESEGVTVAGDWQLAEADGLFVALCALDDEVRRGQPVAEIRGFRTKTVTIQAERDGLVIGLRSKAYIRRGNWAVLIGERAQQRRDRL